MIVTKEVIKCLISCWMGSVYSSALYLPAKISFHISWTHQLRESGHHLKLMLFPLVLQLQGLCDMLSLRISYKATLQKVRSCLWFRYASSRVTDSYLYTMHWLSVKCLELAMKGTTRIPSWRNVTAKELQKCCILSRFTRQNIIWNCRYADSVHIKELFNHSGTNWYGLDLNFQT